MMNKQFAKGPAKVHLPVPMKTQPVEGMVDGNPSGKGNDASSRTTMGAGMVKKAPIMPKQASARQRGPAPKFGTASGKGKGKSKNRSPFPAF